MPPDLITLDYDPRGESNLRIIVVKLINYITNHLISSVPSFRLRHAWYRRVVGVRMQPGAAIFMSCYIWHYGPRHMRSENLLTIGPNTLVNRGCCLDARGPLTIGANVSISPEVTILTTYHQPDDPSFETVSRPTVIEDHAFIGMRAMVMPGVVIGRGAVVAAGAVVTKDVAPFTVVAGVPAVRIRGRSDEAVGYRLTGRLPLFE